MRPFGILCFSFLLLTGACARAQQTAAATPAAQAPAPPPAYDTAALPKNKKEAWAMLRAANGLHGKQIKPWAVTGHYKFYGQDGKVSVEGTVEIVWAAPDRWRKTFTEDGISTTEWRMPDGAYVRMGKPDGLDYPREMLQDVIEDPLGASELPLQIPEFLDKEKILSVEMSCFRNAKTGVPAGGIRQPEQNVLFCAEPGRPILRIAVHNYTVFLNRIDLFDGRFVAREFVVRDDDGLLLLMDTDTLALASDGQMRTLDPPPGLQPTGWISLPMDGPEYDPAAEKLHRVSTPAPRYPQSMKSRRVQGVVRLAVVIGVDGSVTVAQVLRSPDPALTQSAEDAVRQWKYDPYLLNGRPVEVHMQTEIRYQMGN